MHQAHEALTGLSTSGIGLLHTNEQSSGDALLKWHECQGGCELLQVEQRHRLTSFHPMRPHRRGREKRETP
jgi:hypothetical protein